MQPFFKVELNCKLEDVGFVVVFQTLGLLVAALRCFFFLIYYYYYYYVNFLLFVQSAKMKVPGKKVYFMY